MFFKVRGIVHGELLSLGQKINQQVYKEIVWHIIHSLSGKRVELWQDKSQMLHQNNVFAHNTRQFFVERNNAILEQPLYTPDLTLWEFLFSSSSEKSSRVPVWR